MFQDEAGFGHINKPKFCWCKRVFGLPYPAIIYGSTAMLTVLWSL
jgi:hypothetical protein